MRQARLPETGEVDQDALAKRVEPETRLQLGTIGGAKPVVGSAQPLAGRGGALLGGRQSLPVRGVRGKELGEGLSRGRLGDHGPGQLRA